MGCMCVNTIVPTLIMAVLIVVVSRDLKRRATTVIIRQWQPPDPLLNIEVNTQRKLQTDRASERLKLGISDCGYLFESPSTNATICINTTFTEALRSVTLQVISSSKHRVKPDASDELSGVFIALRTTFSYHPTRLSLLMATWMQTMNPAQVHIIRLESSKATSIMVESIYVELSNLVYIQVHITTDTKEDQWLCLAKRFGKGIMGVVTSTLM